MGLRKTELPAEKPGGPEGRRRLVGRPFFRHSATTFLHQAGAPDSIVDNLTGHTTPGETARYTKSSNLKQLQAAIDAVDIGVTFDELYIDNLDIL
jgi:integrase